jgi:hypothetical protein
MEKSSVHIGVGTCGQEGNFAASSGNVTDEMIAEYIERQTQKSPDKTDDFSVEDEL